VESQQPVVRMWGIYHSDGEGPGALCIIWKRFYLSDMFEFKKEILQATKLNDQNTWKENLET